MAICELNPTEFGHQLSRNEFNLRFRDPYLTQIRPGQIRVTD